MQELVGHPDGHAIDMFHSTARRDEEPLMRLRQLALAANVRLHLWIGAEEGRLNAEQIMHDVPDWRTADVWFCGPVEFGKTLRKRFLSEGLRAGAFHQELFHLR
jgi:predicted ferric reductase